MNMVSASEFLYMRTSQMESELDKHMQSARGIQKEFDHLSTKMKDMTKQLKGMNDHTAVYEGILKLRKETEASRDESQKQLRELEEKKKEMDAQHKELERSRTEAEARHRELEQKVLDAQNRLEELERNQKESEERAQQSVAIEPTPSTAAGSSNGLENSNHPTSAASNDIKTNGAAWVSLSTEAVATKPQTRLRPRMANEEIHTHHIETTVKDTVTVLGQMASPISLSPSNSDCGSSPTPSFRSLFGGSPTPMELQHSQKNKGKQPAMPSDARSVGQDTDTETQWVEDLGLRMPMDIFDLSTRFTGHNTPELATYWSKTLDQKLDQDFDRLMRWLRLQHPIQPSHPEPAVELESISVASSP